MRFTQNELAQALVDKGLTFKVLFKNSGWHVSIDQGGGHASVYQAPELEIALANALFSEPKIIKVVEPPAS